MLRNIGCGRAPDEMTQSTREDDFSETQFCGNSTLEIINFGIDTSLVGGSGQGGGAGNSGLVGVGGARTGRTVQQSLDINLVGESVRFSPAGGMASQSMASQSHRQESRDRCTSIWTAI